MRSRSGYNSIVAYIVKKVNSNNAILIKKQEKA